MRPFQPSEDLRANHAANAGVSELLAYCRAAVADLQKMNEGEHGMETTQLIRGQIKFARTLLEGFAPQPKMERARIPAGPGLDLEKVPYGMQL